MLDLPQLIAVFSLGLTASFSPCLFPVLPSFIAFISKTKEQWWKGVIASVLVTAGIMTVFLALGIVFTSLIGYLSIYYNFFRQIQGILLIVLGILLSANKSIYIPKLEELKSLTHNSINNFSNTWVLSYLMGLSFAALAAPCAAIAFISLFTLIATETVLAGGVLMIIFSFGAGIPFLLMGFLIPLLVDGMTDNFRRIQVAVPKIAGVSIIAVGLILILEANAIL